MATIIGTGLNDVLAGTVDADLIEGGAGNDRINGGAGDDEIFGGIGSDILTGDAGNDRIFGEDGNDGVYGGGGNDTIDGGVGDDILIGDGGNDEILGGAGHDKLYGGTGNDRLDGGSGDDLVYGEAGDDILVYRSGDGNDTFFGGIGNDRLELQLNGSDITEALRADLVTYQTWAANQAAAAGTSTALAGQATGDTFAFASLGISISVVEGLSIVVDGHPVTMESLFNQAPTNITLSNASIAEDAAPGTVVGLLSGTDPDAGQSETLSFALADPSSAFEIVGSQLVVKPGAALDFEVQRTHSVNVTATDSSGLRKTQTLTITIDDVNEASSGGVAISGFAVDTSTNDAILTATQTIFDPDGMIGDALFQWHYSMDGATWNEIEGATHASYTPSGMAIGAFVKVAVTYADAFGRYIVTSPETFVVGSGAADTLDGSEESDVILGLAGNDVIVGFSGADTVDGGTGTDTIRLTGTSSDLNAAADVQIVDVEAISFAGTTEGIAVDLSRQTDGFRITGSGFADTITGSSGADIINAGSGDDVIIGFAGADRINGGGGMDTLVLSETSADLNGAANNQLVSVREVTAATATGSVVIDLSGQSEGFWITGSAFADRLSGGQGNDNFSGFTFGDTLDGAGGTDTLRLAGSSTEVDGASDAQIVNIEAISFAGTTEGIAVDLSRQTDGFRITGSGFADTITGSSGADIINAGSGDDVIIGFAGADRINGGGGMDTLVLSETSADLNGAANNQLVSVREVTAATATGSVVIDLSGQSEGFWITGSAFADVLTGGAGSDRILAGDGDDTILGFVGTDNVDGESGYDTIVISQTSATLNSASNARIVNVEAVSASAASSAVTIDLSRQKDGFSITGGDWADSLTGSAGLDIIAGGAGDDNINGGAGADMMTGGSGADTFVFSRHTETGTSATTRDQILDFVSTVENGLEHDIIDLSAIDAIQGGSNDAFTFNPTAWNGAGNQFTAAGQLSYQYVTDQNGVESTIISGNINNNLAPDFQIALAGHVYLTASDFIL